MEFSISTNPLRIIGVSLIIVAILISGVAGYFVRSSETITTTSTTVKVTSETVTELSPTTKTTTQTVITSPTANLSFSYLPIGTQVSMNGNSSIEVFVRYYFYDSNKTVTISPTNNSLVFIWGGNYSADISTTNPNFTIREASPNIPLKIGGADDENEGAVVAYEIHSSSNSNGSYALGVYQLFPEVCNIEFPLIVGNGSPNYASKMIGGCIVWTANNPSAVENQLLAQVVGIES